MLQLFGILISGFFLLLKGADWLIESSGSIAKKFHLPELIVGLTLVSFGTSLPEFFINVISRLSGDTDMTIGDLLGSNIANILLVLGISAVIRPIILKRNTVRWEVPFALVASVVLGLLSLDEKYENSFFMLTRWDGVILLLFFILFLIYIYHLRKDHLRGLHELEICQESVAKSVTKLCGGILALALGAKGVVTGGVGIANLFKVPESVVGLTLVAIGTSLPELVTSGVASFKGRSDIAAGNVIGSNIFNICWILGVSSATYPLQVDRIYLLDIKIVIAVTLLLFLSLLISKNSKIGRSHGYLFLMLYFAYVYFLWRRQSF